MISLNIQSVKERISNVCARLGRDPGGVTVVAVSKGRPAQEIQEALTAGIADIGENRIQEAILKYNAIRSTGYVSRIKWHMIGHLQTNKVKDAVAIFDLIQSVDSIDLARQIDKQACRINKLQGILVQINTSGEASKFGLKPQDAIAAIKEMAELKNIEIRGLMTIAAAVDDPQGARPFFLRLKQLKDKINNLSFVSCPLSFLSMGMSDDFEVAIEEGSSMVRLGRAIFD